MMTMCLYKVTNAVNKPSQRQNPFPGIIWSLALPNDWLMLGASGLQFSRRQVIILFVEAGFQGIKQNSPSPATVV